MERVPLARYGRIALLAGALVAVFLAACGDAEEEPAPTIRPGPDNKAFGDPAATVTITEYFDYR
jgi:hypothetical protein